MKHMHDVAQARFAAMFGMALLALGSIYMLSAAGTPPGDSAIAAAGQFDTARLLKRTAIFIGVTSLLMAVFLVVIAKLFYRKADPRVAAVLDVLPHAECGACGYAGCESYAEAVVNNPSVPANLCVPGGGRTAVAVAALCGKTSATKQSVVARVLCGGGTSNAKNRGTYHGIRDCRAANLTGGGDKICRAGCLGYGSCVAVCPFKAITMSDNDLPIVNAAKCTGCGKCVAFCPRKVFITTPRTGTPVVACRATGRGAEKKAYCSAACIGCGASVKVCPVNAISLENGLAAINPALCTACGACVERCPTEAIVKTG
jgi:Na+-translocating ferredoxin:NAD+ oxidoreductase RNF subunit RnfB